MTDIEKKNEINENDGAIMGDESNKKDKILKRFGELAPGSNDIEMREKPGEKFGIKVGFRENEGIKDITVMFTVPSDIKQLEYAELKREGFAMDIEMGSSKSNVENTKVIFTSYLAKELNFIKKNIITSNINIEKIQKKSIRKIIDFARYICGVDEEDPSEA